MLHSLTCVPPRRKHDKSGRFRPLRADIIAALGKASFVAALQEPAFFRAISGAPLPHATASDEAVGSSTGHAVAAAGGGGGGGGGGYSSSEAVTDDAEVREKKSGEKKERMEKQPRRRVEEKEEADKEKPQDEQSRALELQSRTLEYLVSVPLVLPASQEAFQEQTRSLLRSVAFDKYRPEKALQANDSPDDRQGRAAISAAHARSLALHFGMTYLGYAALLATRKPFSAVKHLIQADLSITPKMLGATDSAMLAAFSLGSLLAAPHLCSGKKVRKPTALAISLIGSGICAALAGMQHAPLPLLLLWSANGFFSAWAYPVCIALVTPWIPPGRRSVLMGLWGTTCALGNLLASASTFYILRRFSWRWCFYLPGGLAAAIGVAVAMLLRHAAAPADDDAGGAAPAAAATTIDSTADAFITPPDAPSPAVALPYPQPPPKPPLKPLRFDRLPPSPKMPSAARPGPLVIPERALPPFELLGADLGNAAAAKSSAVHIRGSSPLSPRRKAYIKSIPPSRSDVTLDGAAAEESLTSVLRLPYVPALTIAYSLLKPCRSTLHFWLPYYMRTALGYDDGTVAWCLTIYVSASVPIRTSPPPRGRLPQLGPSGVPLAPAE